MAKDYKMLVTTTYVTERIVKADSKEDVENQEENILKTIDILDDIPDVDVEIYERSDMDDDDVEVDLTKGV